MPRPPAKSRTYNELTIQQLRSFSETARLGSLAAAAKSLGLTHPTVREQVLALQAEFQVKLIEPHGRGCHLTAEGRLLAEMVAPIVTSASALKQRFDLARGKVEAKLVVAGTPRIFQEDLPAAVEALLRERPQVRLTFLELRDGQVAQAVESGAADLGLTAQHVPDPPLPGLSFEPGYELETLLITSRKHPLARKRSVRPADLRRYPLISSHHTFSDEPEITAMLEQSRVFEGPAPRVEPFLAATVRAYVELNLGIALLYGQSPRGRKTALHERSMSRYFGRVLVHVVFRPGSANEELARAFASTIKRCHEKRSRG
jgi:DNA-binding transcriptional LysR family regulator